MIAAYHLLWSAYGCWLPNDPRGSSSQEIRTQILEEIGQLHFRRKKVQPCRQLVREFYRQADDLLRHQRLEFANLEIDFLGTSFAETILKQRYTCYGCAIMSDHVHLLIRKHRQFAEEMIAHFQQDSRQAMIQSGRRAVTHPVWGGPGWKVFLDSQEDITRTVKYIDDNPIKVGCPRQIWDFVQPYDGWLPGVGRRY